MIDKDFLNKIIPMILVFIAMLLIMKIVIEKVLLDAKQVLK